MPRHPGCNRTALLLTARTRTTHLLLYLSEPNQTMTNKKYRGLVVAAPPHLNPKHQPDRYFFSGTAVPTGEAFAHSFRVISLSGCVPPGQFAEDVAAQSPLPGDLELIAPAYDLGTFSYFQPATGKHECARADDVTGHKPEQLHTAPQMELAPDLDQADPEFAEPATDSSTPGDTF